HRRQHRGAHVRLHRRAARQRAGAEPGARPEVRQTCQRGVIGEQMKQRADDFLELVERAKRGRLKLYIGFAAGVGKTYRMLEEAHALKARGVDTAVAFVETHGRAETAAKIVDLEVIARKRIEYRGVVVEEMDLEAVLARRPQVAVVDEIAHTN